jgi:3-carboxy-cis,cis-muconate cycloisomerase
VDCAAGSFTLAAGALSQTRTILSGLNVDPERMRANLDLSRGLIVSEAVMMGLAPYLGRERSHDLVYDICSEVSAGNGIFLDLLAAHPAITLHLRRDALSALLDPANYLGMAPQRVDAVLEINHKEKGKL